MILNALKTSAKLYRKICTLQSEHKWKGDNNMNITTNKLTIAQLFATNEQFMVPSYQRRYAWGYNQIKALFDDIRMLKEGDGHLFGMIGDSGEIGR